MHFDRHAAGFEGQAHGGTDVVQAVDRRDGEVAALHARTVAGVAAIELLGGRPGSFLGEDLAVDAGHVDVPLDGVEDEEFGFRTEEHGVTNTAALQIGFGALGDGARVTVETI